MGVYDQIINPQDLRSIDSATINGAYQLIDSLFGEPIIILKIVNDSDQAVTVSYNGTDDHDYIPANSFTLYDVCANKFVDRAGMKFSAKRGVYVKGTAGTGNIYVIALSTD